MTTDRELLEMAAKAARYQYAKHGGYIVVDGIPGNWNPLTDDGDALRLAVKLEIELWFGDGGLNASGMSMDIEEDYGEDPAAATRRAIVRAAAAIGEAMK